MRRIIMAAAAAVLTLTALAGVASSTERGSDKGDEYVTVAWKLPITSSVWNKAERPTGDDPRIWPQALVATVTTGHPDLTAFDWLETCGVYQIDVYHNTKDAKALIKSAVLTSPEADSKFLVKWKMLDNGDCVTPPTTPPTTAPPVTTPPTTAPPVTTPPTTAPPAQPATPAAPAAPVVATAPFTG